MFKKARLSLFVAPIFLLGCAINTPEKLGISNLEWMSYSQDRQKSLLADYAQMQKELAGKEEEKKEDYKISIGTYLEVSIFGGKIMFPPSFINWQNYEPVRFVVFKGECSNIPIMQISDSDSKTELGVCFQDNVLYLDSSHYDLTKKMGSVTIYSSPLWLNGFTYKDISSTGYVRLSNVNVEVTQKEAPLPVAAVNSQPQS
jgi:hypothetical protein